MIKLVESITRFFRGDRQSMPTRSVSSIPYEGASTGKRTSSWATTRDAVNSVWFSSQDQLVSRSRDLVRKDSWATKAVEEWVSNAIGCGIKPQSLHPNEKTKLLLQELWNEHVLECDNDGLTDMYGLQALAFRSMVEGGEVFVRKQFVRGLRVPLQYQLLESEQLPYYIQRPMDFTPANHTVHAGIERLGRKRTAYYFYKNHPGETLLYGGVSWDLVRIPADEVFHLYRPLRPGQLRGLPWMANALIRLWELDQYDDAELLRKKFAAMVMGFITRKNTESSIYDDATDQVSDLGSGAAQTSSMVQDVTMEAGTLQELEDGEDVKFTEPADVGGNYEAFERQMLMRIAAGLGLPYFMLTGDLKEANFSSLREGKLAFRRLCEQIQYGCFIFQFCRPSWKAMVEAAVLAGEIDARDYQKNKALYLATSWHTPKWEWVDPEKEVKAEIMSIRAGLKSRGDSINERGEDEEEVDRKIKRDNDRADKNGLIYDSDPRYTDTQGKARQQTKEAGAEDERQEVIQ